MPKEIQKIKEEDTMEEEEFEEIHLEGEEEVNFTGIKETMEVMVIPIFLVLIAHKKKKKNSDKDCWYKNAANQGKKLPQSYHCKKFGHVEKLFFKRLGSKPISMRKMAKKMMEMKINYLLHVWLQMLTTMIIYGILIVGVVIT